jgi:hypothetical protein
MAKSTGAKPANGTKPARIKTAVYLSPESYKCLGAYCLKEDETQSDIIERLIKKSLSGYYVGVRGGSINGTPSQATPSNETPNQATPSALDDRQDSADNKSNPDPKED